MRAFIILGFLIAASSAASLGYNYGPGKSGNLEGSGSSLVGTVGLAGTGSTYNSGSSGNLEGSSSSLIGNIGGISGSRYGSGLINSGSGIIGTGGLINTGGYGGRLISAGGLINSGGSQIISGGSGLIGGGSQIISGGSGLIGGGSQIISGGSGLIGGGSQIISGGGSRLIGGGGSTNVIGIPSLDSIPQTVEYSKQFFSFEAPEEIQEEGTVTKQLSNVLKKNLQVVFIKAPENNQATNAALQLAKQAIEQRTAIYVLSKQNDGAQLVGQLQQIQESVPTVPEVRIVKYRTPQDLAYAKEIIQAQYEQTGGSTQNFDGGVAPVLNYASGGNSGSTVLLGGSNIGSNIGSNYGSTQIISSGPSQIIGGGSSQIIGGGSLLGSNLGSGLGSTQIIGTGGSQLLGSGLSSRKIINSGSLIGGNYALGSNQVSSVSAPETTQYLPPLKKK
ncbi:keratin, type I cytoskeletal 14-like [Episyrphus balteatus]|uniref:keratin, type I cytoskeletal 14-like n=1 Tax=Episyrphus balteatus TaxID=286459 RepID=UPI002486AE5D|nr:keratin, type I cytoskeletal 14-like [Episyrphus balteatus]